MGITFKSTQILIDPKRESFSLLRFYTYNYTWIYSAQIFISNHYKYVYVIYKSLLFPYSSWNVYHFTKLVYNKISTILNHLIICLDPTYTVTTKIKQKKYVVIWIAYNDVIN